MKITIATIAAFGLMLGACEQAPADGTSETPLSQETSEAPVDVAVPAETTPRADAPATATTSYDGPIPKPIMVGLDGADMDACGSWGQVTGLNPRGDNYLSVRDAPSASVKERDRLDSGQAVAVCSEENGWYGIVYSENGNSPADCETGSAVATARPYTGSCAQGWVSKKFVTITAG